MALGPDIELQAKTAVVPGIATPRRPRLPFHSNVHMDIAVHVGVYVLVTLVYGVLTVHCYSLLYMLLCIDEVVVYRAVAVHCYSLLCVALH